MALTLKAEQRLAAAKLVGLFEDHRAAWLDAAKQTYEFIKANFPADATIRPDDVAQALIPILEVDQRLRARLNASKLTQKYWITDFTDLIIDRVWDQIR
jgi:hypothetical protein